MSKDADEVAKLLFELTGRVVSYKSKCIDKMFKVNASGLKELSERQFEILFIIEVLKINTLTELAIHLSLSNNGLSTIISKMASNGYLKKDYSGKDEDGRKVLLSVTDKGRNLLYDFSKHLVMVLEDFYLSLNAKQQIDFYESVSNLIAVNESVYGA